MRPSKRRKKEKSNDATFVLHGRGLVLVSLTSFILISQKIPERHTDMFDSTSKGLYMKDKIINELNIYISSDSHDIFNFENIYIFTVNWNLNENSTSNNGNHGTYFLSNSFIILFEFCYM